MHICTSNIKYININSKTRQSIITIIYQATKHVYIKSKRNHNLHEDKDFIKKIYKQHLNKKSQPPDKHELSKPEENLKSYQIPMNNK